MLPSSAAARYQESVTESEIRVGMLDPPLPPPGTSAAPVGSAWSARQGSLVVLRDIIGLPPGLKPAEPYLDLAGTAVDRDAEARLRKLRERLRSALMADGAEGSAAGTRPGHASPFKGASFKGRDRVLHLTTPWVAGGDGIAVHSNGEYLRKLCDLVCGTMAR